MKIEEANKIIAEYMGRKIESNKLVGGRMGSIIDPSAHYLDDIYSESLDALVPVWEKLNIVVTHLEHEYAEFSSFKKHPHKAEVFLSTTGNTIQESACIATAKAIQELTKKERERKASEYFERSKAKTNEIVLLKRKLSDNTETINTERMKVDMLERKVDTAVKALWKAYFVSINESDWSVRNTIADALEKLKELK